MLVLYFIVVKLFAHIKIFLVDLLSFESHISPAGRSLLQRSSKEYL